MPIRVQVECHAGYRGEETPRVLVFGERRIAVAEVPEVPEVIDRWYGPDHRYFKLRAESGATYLVRHDEEADAWELVVWEGG